MLKRGMLFVLLAGIGAFGFAGCGDDDSGDDVVDTVDTGADADADGDGDEDVGADADADVGPTCDPPCDPNACEACVDGTCTSTCTTGTACDGAGHCVAIPTGAVGDPCMTDDDCDGGFCLTEYAMGTPGGYCATECGADGSCDDGLCVTYGSSLTFCAADCAGETDCRDGYMCLPLSSGSICWSDCDSDTQCTSTGHCEVDTTGEAFSVCTCPPGEHINDDATDCVYDDCDYLDCPSRHMDCNATGGCGGSCATCDGCNPSSYVESTHHCYPAGATWGGACETDADCPGTGTPGRDTFCDPSGGGNCIQYNGPDWVGEGSPCTGDPDSVGIAVTDFFSGRVYEICVAGCAADTDCIPGLFCDTGSDSGTVQYCAPITECATAGCNDPDSTLYCAEDGACYTDGCAGDPCAGVAHGSGECLRSRNDFVCICDEGYAWNGETGACEAFACPATDVTPGATLSAQDLCAGTTEYDAAGDGSSCTGYSTTANELLYRLVVPAFTQVTITMDGTTFDASLWVTTSCADRTGAFCVAGADDEVSAAETLTLANYEAADRTYYVVADSYSGCGTFSLSVSAATAVPCGNGTLQSGEACDDGNHEAGDGCNSLCEIEFGYACTGAGAGSCSAIESIGSFGPGDAIPAQTGGPIAAGASVSHMITFTGEVLLDGNVVATAGNPDVRIVGPTGTLFSHLAFGAEETWSGDRLPAGTYEIRITAFGSTAIPSYTLNLASAAP